MFDTHCHLNFQIFNERVDEVIKTAKAVGVDKIIIPGTDLPTSKKAVRIAEKYEGVYAAVGIHPHHVFEVYLKVRHHVFRPPHPKGTQAIVSKQVSSLSSILKNPKVVAIGEVGIDRHYYQRTKHENYQVNQELIDLQKKFFIEQIKLANRYRKALIIHNREAKKDVLKILTTNYQLLTTHFSVFHCCGPDEELLDFAKKNNIFIGVDGDITYRKDKQKFIKKVPLEMLVLETDSPYLSPFKKFPNEPKNIKVTAELVAKLKNISLKEVAEKTTENARKLFFI